MKRQWQPEELIEHFIVLPDEQALLPTKTNATVHNQLGFAVLLKFFQYAARFPLDKNEVPKAVVTFIGNQLGIPYEQYLRYNWSGRTIKSHRTQIRAFLGFRTATRQDEQELREWLLRHLLPLGSQFEQLKELVYQWLRAKRIEPPTPEQVERLIHSATHSFEKNFCAATLAQLSEETIAKINVVERWNGANNFILYGKSSEIATNSLDEQHATVLCMHLLQLCLVYINTLMLQRVLSENQWLEMMQPDDFRALTPLIWNHVNPYGLFQLDMNERLMIEESREKLVGV